MDQPLRCNVLACRKQLEHQVVVTNCSHCFCVECANNFVTVANRNGQYICPACDTVLGNEYDISVNLLNPSDEYKSSILSGLHPTVILEIAGRAISFWSYQSQQEIVYQEHISGGLRDKFNGLSAQLDNVIHDANNEVTNLQNRVKALSIENENMTKKNHELAEALREKSRKQLQIQEQYDRLRRKTLMYSSAQEAAETIERTHVSQNQIPMTPQHGNQAGLASNTPALGLGQNIGGTALGSDTLRRCGTRISLPNFVTQGGGVEASRSPGTHRTNMGPPSFIPSRNVNGNNGPSWGPGNGIPNTPLRRAHLQGQNLTNSIHGRAHSDNTQHRPTLGLVSQGTLNSIANANNFGNGNQRSEGLHSGLIANAAARSSARQYANDLHQYQQGLGRAHTAENGILLN